MEEWKYTDFRDWILNIKNNSLDPNNIWETITKEITPLLDSISPSNLDNLFIETFNDGLLSTMDLSNFFMIAHMYGHPWIDMKEGYRNVLSTVKAPVVDSFSRVAYDRLPESIRIYRVLNNVTEIDLVNIGYCWSLNKDNTLNTFGGKCGAIISGKCKKDKIAGFFNYRFEDEVVIIPENVQILTVSFYEKD